MKKVLNDKKLQKKLKKMLTNAAQSDKMSIVLETGGKQETRETKNFQKNKKVVDKAKSL